VVVAVVAFAAAAPAAVAADHSRQNAGYVEYLLETYWATSDGWGVVSASCGPWFHHGGHFVRSDGEWVGSAWKCDETDQFDRRFGDHVRIRRSGHLSVVEVACDDRGAGRHCPT
jgi:hypothetical protein